ncbi:hypothetical protein HZH66_003941 [Vespula vulgaris]|uniref:Uncharacterized protein n=1 Tax=Vespula vulgaris TaxID=7454 RepID=A0A834NDJ5_VESVU|nr:hypothetical protein HZH66_003941 [Vespula vulgaris]
MWMPTLQAAVAAAVTAAKLSFLKEVLKRKCCDDDDDDDDDQRREAASIKSRSDKDFELRETDHKYHRVDRRTTLLQVRRRESGLGANRRCRWLNGRFHLKSCSPPVEEHKGIVTPLQPPLRKVATAATATPAAAVAVTHQKGATPWRTLKYAEFTPRSREYGKTRATPRRLSSAISN